MSNDTKGMLLVFFAALCWSTNSMIIKSLSLSPYMIAGMRALIAGVAFAAFLRPRRINWRSWKLYASVLVYAVQSTCIVVSLKLTSTAIAVGMQFTAPIWIYLVQRIKGYPFYWRRALPLAVLTAGVVISMFSKADNVTLLGNIIALSTGIWFALITVLSKDTGKDNPVGIVSINNLTMAALVLPIFCTQDIPGLFVMDAKSWLLLIALGIGQFGMGYALYTIGLKYTSAAKAAMISPMEMVLSPIWAALVIGELPDAVGLIGFLTIIAGIGLEVIFTVRYERAAERVRAQEAMATANKKSDGGI